MRQTFSKIVSEDLSPLLPKIKAETLLVFGSNDTETPLWMGQKMEQEIPDAGLVVFEGRSHFAYLEEWPRFCALIREFLI
jgi:pimeloyl-ACP methyl ester carboxylesterase